MHFAFVFTLTCPLIYRFAEGLECLGVRGALSPFPSLMVPLFVHCEQQLDAVQVELLFTATFSEEGSNRRQSEQRCHTHWHDFLQDLEGRFSPSFILWLLCNCSNYLCG